MRTPINASKFILIKKAFERNGGDMLSSTELDEYLDKRGANAITLSDKIIIFRHGSPPTASELFEELIHTSQFSKGRVSTEVTVELEIEAKEKLIRNQKQYSIPDHENEQTKNQLLELIQLLNKGR